MELSEVVPSRTFDLVLPSMLWRMFSEYESSEIYIFMDSISNGKSWVRHRFVEDQYQTLCKY